MSVVGSESAHDVTRSLPIYIHLSKPGDAFHALSPDAQLFECLSGNDIT